MRAWTAYHSILSLLEIFRLIWGHDSKRSFCGIGGHQPRDVGDLKERLNGLGGSGTVAPRLQACRLAGSGEFKDGGIAAS